VQRLDRNNFFTPTGASYVAVIDIETDTFVDTDPAPGTQPITLTGRNPFTDIRLDVYTNKLYLSSVGFFGLQDGGVEYVDPLTFQTQPLVLTESSAGGDINDVVIVGPDRGYAIISDASFNNVLVSFNPQTGLKTGTLYAPGAYVLNDIELSPDRELFLTDRTAVLPGIRIYNADTGTEITSNPIDVGLPPFDITFSVAQPTGVANVSPPRGARLGQNYPNPFNPSTTIPFALDRAGQVRVAVYDAAGRRVATLLDEDRAAGEHVIPWDGRDASAMPVSSGVYFVQLEARGLVDTRKLVLIK
jgi:hypothetical protein